MESTGVSPFMLLDSIGIITYFLIIFPFKMTFFRMYHTNGINIDFALISVRKSTDL